MSSCVPSCCAMGWALFMIVRTGDLISMLECVPNFSEGHAQAVVQAIADVIAAVPGVLFLGAESDADHNRSVMTFAGPLM